MRRGAEVLVDVCAGVRAGEQVVIVTDDFLLPIAEAVATVASDRGGVVTIVNAPPRTIDNEEPGGAASAAMHGADVVFLPVTHALSHTRAAREAIGAGARVVSMSAFTERMMQSGGLFADFAARRPLCDALAQRLTDTSAVRVTNPGSDAWG